MNVDCSNLLLRRHLRAIQSLSKERPVRRGAIEIESKKAQEIFAKMNAKSNTERNAPDTVTFNTLLAILVNARDNAALLPAFQLMKSRGVPRSAVTYNTLLLGFSSLASEDETNAFNECVKEMRQEGFPSTEKTFVAQFSAARAATHLDQLVFISFAALRLFASCGAHMCMVCVRVWC
jgi:hypothetical protein